MVTTLYAGILGILYVGLSLFTIAGRFKHQVNLGSGGNEDMQKRIRMHGNFAEYVPFAILLIFLVELEGASETVVHGLGIVLVVARILHALALYNVSPIPRSREISMVTTLLLILVTAGLCVKAYFIF